jgi:hypothetical protein
LRAQWFLRAESEYSASGGFDDDKILDPDTTNAYTIEPGFHRDHLRLP